MTRSLKALTLGALALAGALASAGAQAGGNTYWSVNVSAPGYPVGVDASFSNAPRVVSYVQPVVVAPTPVVYAPQPVVYAAPAVVMAPRPVVYYGPPAYDDEGRHWKWRHGHRHHHHHDRHDD